MDKWLVKLLLDNAQEMSRLMEESEIAKNNNNIPLLKLKLAGLQHAMDVGDRLVQLVAIWKSSKDKSGSKQT